MEKKRGKWLIAVLILVLAAACAGGFYLVKSRSRQENGQFPGGGQMPGDIPVDKAPVLRRQEPPF